MGAGTIVVVGGGLAGATAAVTLREEGFEGRLVLVGAEAGLPYERPPLSKEYLRGEKPLERFLVRAPEVYESLGVELRPGVSVTRLEPATRDALLDDGDRLRYDRLLLCTGGRNRRFPIPGLDLEGVHDLRTVANADRIREEARPGRRAVVVGLGFIGSEVAAALRALGVDVAAVEVFSTPLERVLGEGVGGVIAELHRERGVELVLGEGVQAFEGAGRVERVVTSAGRVLECDFAVVGLGIEPAVELAEGTAVDVDNGIVVDEYCRASVQGIYAAGDVANHFHPLFGRRIRVEHWLNAIDQGAAAARSMLGKGEPYAEVPWFWSDQYDANLQYAGHHTGWDELVVRGSLAERKFAAFYVTGGVVDAVVALDQGREVQRAKRLIASRAPVDTTKLGDPEVDLRTLVPAP
jgi:3-phenylpropionate/trans-cinnamate dioxygenase ferredoxin reductase subunit